MLQQTNNDNKLLFLELFTKELIINSVPKIEKEEEREIKKEEEKGLEIKKEEEREIKKEEEKGLEIKKEDTRPAEIEEEYVASHKITPSPMIIPQPAEQKIILEEEPTKIAYPQEIILEEEPTKIAYPQEIIAKEEPTQVTPNWQAQQIPPQQIRPKAQEIRLAFQKPIPPPIQIKKPFKAQFIPPQQIRQKRIIQRMPQTQKFGVSILGSPIKPGIMPVSAPKTEEKFDLGKLSMFLTDKEITVIECPGPDKFILVKKAGRVSLTKVKLSQKEIDEILKNFSEKTRIPIIKGIFRTTVGNLTISAVVSDFVGSRFILYKASAYSLITH